MCTLAMKNVSDLQQADFLGVLSFGPQLRPRTQNQLHYDVM